MVWEIAIKEIKEITRTRQFAVASIVIMILMALAIGLSYNYYQQIQEQHEEARINERAIWEQQDEKNPHSAAHYGTYAFKPKYPLSLIDSGVEKFLGISVFLEAHNRNEADYAAAADQTGLSRFGSISPDFILLFLIPLFIILIGHNVMSKEYERGTFRLVKSQGVNMTYLVLGKWMGIYIPIFLLAGIVFSAFAICLNLFKDFGPINWLAFGLMVILYLIYYAIFTSLTVVASVNIKNSGLTMVSLLAIWMISCLALPKAATAIIEENHPYPTQQAFTAAITEDKAKGLNGHTPWSEASKKLEEETLKEHGVTSLEELPFNFDGYRMQKGEEHEAAVFFAHYQELKKIYENQKSGYNTLSIISPYLPVRFLSMSLANTDYESHWHFSDAAEKYRLEMQGMLNGDFAEHAAYGDWSYKSDKSLWKKIPEFNYHPPGLTQILASNTQSLISLLAWSLITFLGVFLSARRI